MQANPPPAPGAPAPSGQAYYSREEVERLLGKGVVIPAPHQVAIARDVSLEAIAPGAELHPFCRLSGAGTRVDAGAAIGLAGPAVLHDAWVGRNARVGNLGPVTLLQTVVGPAAVLGCGVAEEAVFLGREEGGSEFTTGYGFRVRKGSLYEEDARSAQHSDSKMTILFPWVTLGSNLNFCDVLVSGGAGPGLGEFSEIGSGVVHFNFTPRGDKATGSLLGNAVEGVFLHRPRLFIGGNASLIGPLKAAFGAVTGAGGRFGGWLGAGLNPPLPPPGEGGAAAFDLEVYGSVRRLFVTQVSLIGELAALDAWYGHARSRIAGGDADRKALYAKGREMVRLNIHERIHHLGLLAGRMERSLALLEAGAPGDARIPQQRALLEHWPGIERHLAGYESRQPEPPAALLEGLDEAAAGTVGSDDTADTTAATDASGPGSGAYTRVIRALPAPAVAAGTDWMRRIAEGVAAPEILELVPALPGAK